LEKRSPALSLLRTRSISGFRRHHFGGPTWKLDDGSAVVGEVIAKADAPEPDAFQWLLLRAKSLDPKSGSWLRLSAV